MIITYLELYTFDMDAEKLLNTRTTRTTFLGEITNSHGDVEVIKRVKQRIERD
jgi:hypothetical protein